MSQKVKRKENSQKSVLAQIQNQAIIVTSQGEVKSQLQADSQDRAPSQAGSCCVASQGQVLTQAQLASQNGVSSQATVASQGRSQTEAQLTSQPNVSSQDRVGTQAENVFSQPTVPTRSQSSSQNAVSSRKRNCECCQCCKDLPVQQAEKVGWRETASEYISREIRYRARDAHAKKQNE